MLFRSVAVVEMLIMSFLWPALLRGCAKFVRCHFDEDDQHLGDHVFAVASSSRMYHVPPASSALDSH